MDYLFSLTFMRPSTVLHGIFSVFSCLKAFNLGPDFICRVRIFYNDIESCVLSNDFASDFFTLELGVRLGDPLSPFLFVLAVEILAIAIRQNTSIKGILFFKLNNIYKRHLYK